MSSRVQQFVPLYRNGTSIVPKVSGDLIDGQYVSYVGVTHEDVVNDIQYPTSVKQKAIADTGEDGGVEGGVRNGDFEDGTGTATDDGWIGAEKYGWYADRYATTISITYDSGTLKLSNSDATGAASVQNVSAVTLVELSKNAIPLIPSTKYRLSGKIKTNNVATDAAFISMTQYDSTAVAGTTTTLTKASGDTDWTYYESIITSDADGAFAVIELHNDVAGNVSDAWFDDIRLEHIDTQAVNTQVATPASVSVTGVTTTDNVDQSLETSGQTYTLGTAIDEGATHRQSFTPTADRGDGKHILSKIQALVAAVGTGDWTLTVHDASNNVLASHTIVNGSMSTGDVDFDVPAILDVGTEYHFHITSTVADGTVTTTTLNDLETVDYHAQFAKHTESPIIEANGAKLDLTGTKLLTGATITVGKDGTGKYRHDTQTSAGTPNPDFVNDWVEITPQGGTYKAVASDTTEATVKYETGYVITGGTLILSVSGSGGGEIATISYSINGIDYVELDEYSDLAAGDATYQLPNIASDILHLKFTGNAGSYMYIQHVLLEADLDCTNVELPLMVPSSEVQTETLDLTQTPIDISEGQFWQLKNDLTGWGSRTITMLASEATWQAQAVSANTIYVYDSNGTSAWTWSASNGLVPPADRTSGVVMAKYLVGDNQIKSCVNDGSMKANFNLAWDEESLRAAINRLTAIANLQYPIVVEVDDVPAIDLQNEPTGASAETGYTNDVTSLRQTAAATPAIAYTGLLPRENQFSEWLDITVVCNDGDGTLQCKLYTTGGTLIETYADLEANPVLTISNPDYKYSRERLVLQISASAETTSTAWSVTDIKWRYQYNG